MSASTPTPPAAPPPAGTVIDLGTYQANAAPAGPDPWAQLPWHWQWPFWRWLLREEGGRRWLPVALVVALLGVLGGAATPPEPRLVPLWTVPGAQSYAAGEQDLYVLAEAAGKGWTLAAHRLADGAIQWEVPVDNPGDWGSVTIVRGMPLTTTPQPGGIEWVTGHDPDTGEARWRHRGLVLAMVAGDRLLFARPPPAAWPVDDGTVTGDGQHPYHVDVVDQRTGELIWTRRFSVGQVVLDPGRDPRGGLAHLVTLDRQGRLTSYDLATGAVLATTGTPLDAQARQARGGAAMGGDSYRVDIYPFARVADGLVMVPEPDTLAAYDAGTLALRWRLPLPDLDRVDPCGALVCAFQASEPNNRMVAIEPADGVVQWARGCHETDPLAPDSCVLLSAAVTRDDWLPVLRLQVAGGELPGGAISTWVLAPASGELVGVLPEWQQLWSLGPGDRWLFGRQEEPLGEDEPPGRLWVAWWRADPPPPPGLEVLGAIDAAGCQAPSGGYLLCAMAGTDDLQVWSVR